MAALRASRATARVPSLACAALQVLLPVVGRKLDWRRGEAAPQVGHGWSASDADIGRKASNTLAQRTHPYS